VAADLTANAGRPWAKELRVRLGRRAHARAGSTDWPIRSAETFQRLGYFVMLREVPAPILQHIAQCAGYDFIPNGLDAYDGSSVTGASEVRRE
jgi:hypothetical protein